MPSLLSFGRRLFLTLLTVLALAAAATGAELRPDELVTRFGKAVVLINAKRGDGSVMQGTGYLVSDKGALVTNFHVIEGATSAVVKLTNGDVYDQVDVVDHDARKDLAVLKIKGFSLATVTLGNSDQVRVGERVYVIGNPLGLENTITDGLLSGTRDTGMGYRLIQISAAISPGSSGSPVFNAEGAVIGTAVSQLVDGQNLNFAVPVNYARGMIGDTPKLTLAELAKMTGTPAPVPTTVTAGVSPAAQLLQGHTNAVSCLAWSPDSKRLASGSFDSSERIWNPLTGEALRVIRIHKDLIGELAWSPDGQRLASCSNDLSVRIIDPVDGTEQDQRFELKGGPIRSVAWSPDGQSMALGGQRMSFVVDPKTFKKRRSLEHDSIYRRVRYSPDGKLLAAVGLGLPPFGGTFGIVVTRETKGGWDRKLKIDNLPEVILSLDWSRDGKQLVTGGGDGAVRLWDTELNRPGRVFRGPTGPVYGVTWNPDARYFASSGNDGKVIIWDAQSGDVKRTLAAHEGQVGALAWSPDGKWLASGGQDRMVRIWNVQDIK